MREARLLKVSQPDATPVRSTAYKPWLPIPENESKQGIYSSERVFWLNAISC